MTITRTAKGTVSDKSAGLSLTIANVALSNNVSLLVGLGYDAGSGAPVVRWGNQVCKPVVTQTGNGVTARIVQYYRRGEANTRDLVATWGSPAPTAKVMLAVEVTEVGAEDVSASQAEAGTTDPDTGAGVITKKADEFLLGVMVSEGPNSDAKGTIQNGFQDGQRIGTVGAPPVSNITAHEIYKITTATESAQAAKTGATSRDWSSVLATFRAVTDYRMAISPTDLQEMRIIFEGAGLSKRNHAFHYNASLDRWELFDVDLDGAGTLIASYTPSTGTWVVE